jgi:hypothetical protein
VLRAALLSRLCLLADRLLHEFAADGIANLHAQLFDLGKKSAPIRTCLSAVHLLSQPRGKLPDLIANLTSLPGRGFLAHFSLLA